MTTDVSVPKASNLALYATADDDFAQMRQRDIIMPNLRLMQPLSPLVVKQKVGSAGDFSVPATQEIIVPTGKIGKIVPLQFWLEWIEWNPNKRAGKNGNTEKIIIERSNDPTSNLAKRAERFEKITVEGKDRVAVTEYYNFICAFADEVDGIKDYSRLFVINFSKTSHRTGKQFLNRLNNCKITVDDGEGGKTRVKAPIWANEWEIFSKVEENDDKESYYVIQIGSNSSVDTKHHETLFSQHALLKSRRDEIRNANTAANADDTEGESGAAKPDTSATSAGVTGKEKTTVKDEPPF